MLEVKRSSLFVFHEYRNVIDCYINYQFYIVDPVVMVTSMLIIVFRRLSFLFENFFRVNILITYI